MANKDYIILNIKQDNREKVLSELKTKVKKILVAWGEQAVTLAKQIITQKKAIDTGRLRNSITHQEGDNYMEVGTNVEYGKYVELGTWKMSARPFIVPSIKDNANKYKTIAEKILQE